MPDFFLVMSPFPPTAQYTNRNRLFVYSYLFDTVIAPSEISILKPRFTITMSGS